ncbi:hypothetical protein EMPG_09779 [Blastomyces silverae]|uniref:Uncharacterized protein n=1 Tax=Blastomyces silverae TaxID=2060906 RepID=A0A0H1BIL2_9EURO|nr:hypothetical protein EMPG_09779 [Blastomyces silverae]
MQVYTIDDGNLEHGISLLSKYKAWSEIMEDIMFLHAHVLIFYSIYKPVNHSEDYACVKLYLHHFFCEIDNLKVIDDLTFSDFVSIYKFCRNAHNHSSDAYEDDISESESEVEDDLQSEESELLNS